MNYQMPSLQREYMKLQAGQLAHGYLPRHQAASFPAEGTRDQSFVKSPLSINLLGPVEISANGQNIDLTAGRVRSLLALLSSTPQKSVSLDNIIDELYVHTPSRNPRNAVQANVLRLRKLLERATEYQEHDQIIRATPVGYMLDLPQQTIDAHRFTSLLGQAMRLSQSAPIEAEKHVNSALELWRGPALSGTEGGLRIQAFASRLNSQRLDALELSCEIRLRLEPARNVVGDLEQFANESPERERLSELLMAALYRTGRQREALETFRKVRSSLHRELGVEPGKTMQLLHCAILNQDPSIEKLLGFSQVWQ
jgi:SARP family transcriptional regulator, regulator of embCAB operon